MMRTTGSNSFTPVDDVWLMAWLFSRKLLETLGKDTYAACEYGLAVYYAYILVYREENNLMTDIAISHDYLVYLLCASTHEYIRWFVAVFELSIRVVNNLWAFLMESQLGINRPTHCRSFCDSFKPPAAFCFLQPPFYQPFRNTFPL